MKKTITPSSGPEILDSGIASDAPQSEQRSQAAPLYTWAKLRSIAFAHKRQLLLANVVAILAVLASVPVPLLLPLMVDEVLLNKPGHIVAAINQLAPEVWRGPYLYIGVALLATICLRIISLLFNVWQTRQFTIISKEIVYRMRKTLLNQLKRVAMREYETLGSGAVASRMVTDLDTIDRFVGSTVSRLIVAGLSIVACAVVLLVMHWQLALLILVFNPFMVLLASKLGRRVKELKKRENHAFEMFQEALTETLDNMQQIRAANRERHYTLRLIDRAQTVRDRSTAWQWKNDAASRSSFMLFLIGVDIFRGAAMLTVVLSDLSIGEMFAVFGYLWYMMGPVNEMIDIQYGFYSANAALGRVNNLLKLDQEPYYPLQLDPFVGQKTVAVEVRDVHFGYDDGRGILNGVSLEIARGEKVALVGASGGGKSTLVQVLLGMYPPAKGTVLFDGVPLEKIGHECLREHVVTVLQHPSLFNTTVRENITLGRDATDEALWEALEIAQMKTVVEDMDKGLDTVVGRHGVRLSGGQRQRLAIARMVVADPQVVILDEATSALDADTERRIHSALNDFLKQRTTLIIAHRLSAVKQADRAYVFEDGEVCEEGHHDQLIRQEGLYARLYGSLQQ